MFDLNPVQILASIPAIMIVFSIFGYFYVKSRGKHHFATRFIPRRKKHSRDYLHIVKEQSRK